MVRHKMLNFALAVGIPFGILSLLPVRSKRLLGSLPHQIGRLVTRYKEKKYINDR